MPRRSLWVLVVALVLCASPSFASTSPQPPAPTSSAPSTPADRTASLNPSFDPAPAETTPLAQQTTARSSSSVAGVLLALGGAWILFLGLGLVRRR